MVLASKSMRYQWDSFEFPTHFQDMAKNPGVTQKSMALWLEGVVDGIETDDSVAQVYCYATPNFITFLIIIIRSSSTFTTTSFAVSEF